MEDQRYVQELNRFLVEVFNDILKTEEMHVTQSCPDLSLREVHVIEAVCRAVDRREDNRASAIAAALRVAAGTLTASVNQLEAKGYLKRVRDGSDKRSVRLHPTEKGRAIDRCHAEFHRELVGAVAGRLEPQEADTLVRVLGGIAEFFQAKYSA